MYVCLFVCMYVAIRRPRVHHALCTCQCAHIAYRNSVTLIVAHQSGRLLELNSQRVIQGVVTYIPAVLTRDRDKKLIGPIFGP